MSLILYIIYYILVYIMFSISLLCIEYVVILFADMAHFVQFVEFMYILFYLFVYHKSVGFINPHILYFLVPVGWSYKLS